MKAFVGQFVKSKFHNHVGRVKAKHIMFSETNEDNEWFEMQRPPIPKEELLKPWYSILVHGAGSVMVPESYIIEVSDVMFDDQKFENPWSDFYFKD
jgi:hypothetical protein